MYDIVGRLFKAFTRKKVVVPKSFLSTNGTHCIGAHYKANHGHLYVFEKSFFFLKKPPTYIRNAEIGSVEFERLDGASR